MTKNSQWSIRRLFLWVFVAALIASQLANFYRRHVAGITDFSINGRPDIERWLTELDPSVKSHEGAKLSPPSADSVDSFSFFVFTSQRATSKQLLEHLKSKIRGQLNDQNWSIQHAADYGNDSFVFFAYNRGTNLRIYAGLSPNNRLSDAAGQREDLGETVTTIKIFQVAYPGR